MAHLDDLYHLGQSTWLNYLRRAFIESGELKQAVGEGVAGITSTPLIFEKAITSSDDYDQAIRELVAQGEPVRTIYKTLVANDIQIAADVLRSVFEMSDGIEGYVTLELNPSLAHDTVGTVAEARHVLHEVNRSNAMIEIPATEAGIAAIESLIRDGINVNATHIFSLETYEKVAQAYLRGIEMHIHSHSVWRQNPVSVASFSLSPIDMAVDELLDEYQRSDLKKQAAIAIARKAYQSFLEIFSGSSWQRLARRGAAVQRLKWTRTTPLSYDYPRTHYIDALAGPQTIVTMSPAILSAYRNHGRPQARLTEDVDGAAALIQELQSLGIDLERVGQNLQNKSLKAFDVYFQSLINSVIAKRDQLDFDWHRYQANLGSSAEVVEEALDKSCEERIVCRIWSGDHTVWKPSPEEITNRIGWQHSVEIMRANTGRLDNFAKSLIQNKNGTGPIRNVVVLGMGGSSLAAELFGKIFDDWQPASPRSHPKLSILDTTSPDVIASLTAELDLTSTFFIVSSKSGGTVETLSAFKYFYNLLVDLVGEKSAGRHFAAITDPGTSLAQLAGKLKFRELFLNDPHIGGRYSVLSYFGLVPAAAAGVDIPRLLDSAFAMAVNSHSCNCPPHGDNIAAEFGAVLGVLAKQGRDKLTIITSPAIASFADWAEQLVAESTGKEGTGILPVVGEELARPENYGNDRIFAYIRLEGDSSQDRAAAALSDAGFPLVTFNLRDIYELGGLFFIWEMATALAGAFLEINPFDQPNVEAAKKLARSVIAQYKETGTLPEADRIPPSLEVLEAFLSQIKAGDYAAVQAYLPSSQEIDKQLRKLRIWIRDRYKIATTVGYGPRYLHSTGQLHKGDGGNGLFIQFTSAISTDIPIPADAGSSESDITFGTLLQSQAIGDASALQKAGRRTIQFHLGDDIEGNLKSLIETLSAETK